MGDDRILRNGEQLVVCSNADMDEWEVKDKRKTVIYINNEAWRLVGKQFFAKNEVRYLLEPWPDAMREIPGRVIRYDEKYIRSRDKALKKIRLESWTYPIFYVLSPLIGLLPSPVKSRIESNFGLSARDATFASLFIELLLIIVSTPLFVLITATAADRSQDSNMVYIAILNSVLHEIVLLLILIIDLAIRYSSYLRDDRSPLGAFEWIWSWIYRKKRRGE